jgi:hypothetical protein
MTLEGRPLGPRLTDAAVLGSAGEEADECRTEDQGGRSDGHQVLLMLRYAIRGDGTTDGGHEGLDPPPVDDRHDLSARGLLEARLDEPVHRIAGDPISATRPAEALHDAEMGVGRVDGERMSGGRRDSRGGGGGILGPHPIRIGAFRQWGDRRVRHEPEHVIVGTVLQHQDDHVPDP